jgi:hypothetical protein
MTRAAPARRGRTPTPGAATWAAGAALVLAALVAGLAPGAATAAEAAEAAEVPAAAEAAPQTTASASAMLYALPDQENFGVGVAAVNRGPLRLEARVNYEAIDAGSLFLGWRWAGAGGAAAEDAWSVEVTPMLGVAFGSIRAVVPTLLASVRWRRFDLYVEAEAVRDLDDSDASFFYAWSELGWSPLEWLRVGLVGQRTRLVASERSLQRGPFVQVLLGRVTLSGYAFNPEASSRYFVFGLSGQF